MTAAVGTLSGGRRAGRWAWRLRYYLPTVLVFVGTVVAWEVAVDALRLQKFILPKPSVIAVALIDRSDSLIPSAGATLFEAVGGLAIGTLAGLVVAVVTARFGAARDALVPFAIAANAVPIIAFAPVMNNWFGVLSPLSKMMIVTVLVFFPVYINVVRGLTDVDPRALELMRSYAASEFAILRRLRIPNALPYFFTALKISTTLSLIGAIVGEYFGGVDLVLGRQIVQSASSLRFDITWAAIILGAAMGIAFYLVVVAIERLVIPWHASFRGGDAG